MNKVLEIQEALKIIREPITVLQENYKYFDEENYNKLVSVYENCQWFINNWEQIEQNIEDLQKKAEHYKHLYSEVKKQKDELETSYDILQKNNTTLVKQKDDVVEYIKNNWYSKNTRDINEIVIGDWRIDILRMLGEIE